MNKYTYFSTKTALDAYALSAIESAKSARWKLQVALIGYLTHYFATGDYTGVADFIARVDSLAGFNAEGMIRHAERHGGLTATPVVIDEVTGKTEMQGINTQAGRHNLPEAERLVFIEAAKKEMWWEAVPNKSAFVKVEDEKVLKAALNKIRNNHKKAQEQADETGRPIEDFLDDEISPATTQMVADLLGFELAIVESDQESSNDDDAVVTETPEAEEKIAA